MTTPEPIYKTDALIAEIRKKLPPAIKVYRREEVPAELHYRDGRSIPPILLLAEDHWTIEEKSRWSVAWARTRSSTSEDSSSARKPTCPRFTPRTVTSRGSAHSAARSVRLPRMRSVASGFVLPQTRS